MWRQHSMSVPDTTRHASQRVVFEEYSEIGYDYRLTDLQAAIGRVQLQRLPAMVARRRDLARRYHELLARIPDLQLPLNRPGRGATGRATASGFPPDATRAGSCSRCWTRDLDPARRHERTP